MRVQVAYGRGRLGVDVPDGATIVASRTLPHLHDERAAFTAAVRSPVAARPLRDLVGADDTVAIVTSDVTRATPSERLIPWILDELAHVSPERFTVIIGTGSHRATAQDEMERLLGREVLERVRVVDHDAHDPAQNAFAGTTPHGVRAFLNRHYLAATKRIVVGFIEPHLYAGFSGGVKGVMPGVAGIETVMAFHSARMVGDPRSTWLRMDDNPTQQMARDVVALAPLDFLVNVTLAGAQRITGFFCGDALAAHAEGAAFCRRAAAVAVPHRFDAVLMTNGGYPLDQNLYQCIKGLSAANGVVAPGGTIVLCAECSDGLPEHGNFKDILRAHATPRAVLEGIAAPGDGVYDQWAAQTAATVLEHARVALHSSLPDAVVRSVLLAPAPDPSQALHEALVRTGAGATCAVIPEGPYVIPYVSASARSAETTATR